MSINSTFQKHSALVLLSILLLCFATSTSAFTNHHGGTFLTQKPIVNGDVGTIKMNALLIVDVVDNVVSFSSSNVMLSSLTDTVFSSDSISSAFNAATFLPQPFWLFLILLPKSDITRKMFGGIELLTGFALVHFFIVFASIIQPDGTAPMTEFADVFDPAGNPQAAMVGMMQYPNFVSEEWSHVLTWDLFVGRWIWLDGLRRGVFTSHSVLLCNLIGPPGLLLHLATSILSGKGLPSNEVVDVESFDSK